MTAANSAARPAKPGETTKSRTGRSPRTPTRRTWFTEPVSHYDNPCDDGNPIRNRCSTHGQRLQVGSTARRRDPRWRAVIGSPEQGDALNALISDEYNAPSRQTDPTAGSSGYEQ